MGEEIFGRSGRLGAALGQPLQPYQPNYAPYVPPVPISTPEEKLREFLKLYEAAKEYDAKTAQPDCEDPVKMQVLDRILERLDAIEKRLGDGGSEF